MGIRIVSILVQPLECVGVKNRKAVRFSPDTRISIVSCVSSVSLPLALAVDIRFSFPRAVAMPAQPTRLCPSTRLSLAVVGFFGFAVVYALRVNLSVAIVCMVNQTAISARQADDTAVSSAAECARHESDAGGNTSLSSALSDQGSYEWSKSSQGLILGAFFYGYVWTQVLGGWLAQRIGAKRVFGATVLGGAVVTLLTPLGAQISFGVLIALRVLLGFFQGVAFPAFHTMWSRWAPPLERSKLVGITYAGAQVGNVLSLPISGVLCDHGPFGGWPSIFYSFGVVAILWVLVWLWFVSDTPVTHKTISSSERDYIVESLVHEVDDRRRSPPVPWLSLLTSLPVWAVLVGHFAGDWGAYMMLTCLPSFLKDVLQFDMTSLGFLASLPYIVYFACINIGGFLADTVRSRGILSTLNTRRAAMIIALGSQAAFLVSAGYCSCGQELLAVGLLTLGTGLSGFQYAGFVVNYMDIAPAFAGPVLGIGNTLSCGAGIGAPYLMGLLTPDRTREQWLRLFWLTAGILVAGTAFFVIFAAGEVQPWAVVGADDDDDDKGEELRELKPHIQVDADKHASDSKLIV